MPVTLKYYPIRFDREHQTKTFEYSRGKTVGEYIKDSKFHDKNIDIVLDGGVVNNLDALASEKSEIIITPRIEEAIGAVIWKGIMLLAKAATAAAKFAKLHPIMTAGMALSSGYSIYQAISMARTKNYGLDGLGLDESSPTYGWDQIQTVQEVGIPVKKVYGRHRTGGNILNQFVSADGLNQYLNILIGVCEGPIKSISDILIDGNPIENYTDITVETRLGTNDQELISGFEELHDPHNINVELPMDDPYSYTTEGLEVDGFSIYVTLPNGLYRIDQNTGASLAWWASYVVEYKLHSEEEWTTVTPDVKVTTLSRSAVRHVYNKRGLTPGQYDIRVTKNSIDSSDYYVCDMFLATIDEVVSEDLIYPNTALFAIKLLATNQISDATPNITFVVDDDSVSMPDVLDEEAGDPVDWEDYYYDPDAEVFRLFEDDSALYWDGETYRTGFCANPIWCQLDAMKNKRYGMGNFLPEDRINESQMLQCALYCEEKVNDGEGNFEKRFRCDVVIDSTTKACDFMTQISAIYQGFVFYSSNGFSVSIDRPGAAVQTFGMGNIVKDSFSQTWKSRAEIYNVIEIEYLDKDLDYANETVTIEDGESLAVGDPRNIKRLRIFVTKKSYALRQGRYALWLSKYINRGSSFKTALAGIRCQPGDLINVSHDVPQWGYSGKVLTGSTSSAVLLDRNVLLEPATQYSLLIQHVDGTSEERTVISSDGLRNLIEVRPAFSSTPAEYEDYVFGKVNIVTKPFRLLGIKREKCGEVSLNCLEYNATVYDDTAVALPTPNYSHLSRVVPNVEDLAVTERLVKMKDGSIEAGLDVWFTKPLPQPGINVISAYGKAKIYLSDDDGESWQYQGETSNDHFQIVGGIIDLHPYKICVVSVSTNGAENQISTSPQAAITPFGKSAPPSDVTTFIVNQDLILLRFGWIHVDDLDLWGYEIRTGLSFNNGDHVAFVQGNTYMSSDLRLGEEQRFWIKAIDTSGNYSLNAKMAVVTVDNIPFRNLIAEYAEEPDWTGDKDDTEVNVNDYLIISEGELSGTYETPIRDLGFLASFSFLAHIYIVIVGDIAFDSDPARRFNSSTTLRFLGEEETAGNYGLEISTSEDDITWTDYSPYQKGDYYCRYFKFRVTLTRSGVDMALACTKFNYWADLPDINDRGDDEVTVANDGVEVLFNANFHQEPNVHIEILTGDGIYFRFEDKDTTGFTVKLYDADGVAVVGTFEWHAYGV